MAYCDPETGEPQSPTFHMAGEIEHQANDPVSDHAGDEQVHPLLKKVQPNTRIRTLVVTIKRLHRSYFAHPDQEKQKVSGWPGGGRFGCRIDRQACQTAPGGSIPDDNALPAAAERQASGAIAMHRNLVTTLANRP
jgi:hypothetical protein